MKTSQRSEGALLRRSLKDDTASLRLRNRDLVERIQRRRALRLAAVFLGTAAILFSAAILFVAALFENLSIAGLGNTGKDTIVKFSISLFFLSLVISGGMLWTAYVCWQAAGLQDTANRIDAEFLCALFVRLEQRVHRVSGAVDHKLHGFKNGIQFDIPLAEAETELQYFQKIVRPACGSWIETLLADQSTYFKTTHHGKSPTATPPQPSNIPSLMTVSPSEETAPHG